MNYHINPETGKPGVCNPVKTGICRYGSVSHYDTKEEARIDYESIMSTLNPLLSPPGSKIIGESNMEELREELYLETMDWHDNTPNEINRYPGIYALSFSAEIKKHLGGKDSTFGGSAKYYNESNAEHAERAVQGIDEIFRTQSLKPRRVFRVVSFPKEMSFNEILESDFKDGKYSDLGYMSTTASVNSAMWLTMKARKDDRKSDKQMVMLEIASKGGLPLQRSKDYYEGNVQSLENEILLDRGIEFSVVSSAEKRKFEFGEDCPEMLAHESSLWNRYHPKNAFMKGFGINVPTIQLEEK